MPSSSLAAADMLAAKSFLANSLSNLAERSATCCSTRAVSSESGACVFGSVTLVSIKRSPLGRCKAGHAIGAHAARQLPFIVQTVQMRYRFAHGKENLVVVELA